MSVIPLLLYHQRGQQQQQQRVFPLQQAQQLISQVRINISEVMFYCGGSSFSNTSIRSVLIH